jgi:hypothetical protein
MEELAIDIINRIIALIETASPHLWRIAVRQAMTRGIVHMIWTLIGLAGCVYIIRWFAIRFKEEGEFVETEKARPRERWQSPLGNDHYWDEKGSRGVLAVLFVFLFLAFVPMTVLNIGPAIEYLVNPEYQAVKILIGLLK